MIDLKKNIKIHIKNNRWKEGSFPNTPEGEKVFYSLGIYQLQISLKLHQIFIGSTA